MMALVSSTHPLRPPGPVLDLLDLRPRQVACLKDVPLGNASWLIEAAGGRLVLRRYHAGATPQDLGYEHAVLAHLAGAGWVVPEPAGDLVEHAGVWYCLTRYVPGRAVAGDAPARLRRRRADTFVPIAHGRHTAKIIPGARFVEFPDHGHLSIIMEIPKLSADLTGSLR